MSDAQVQWLRLRAFNGSQDAAFEEVCKQLLGAECRAAGGAWIPKGTIDAGVEGYGVMPNGDNWGFQAKWFLTSPTPKQWSDVDQSVDVALNRHPRLTRYVVCMPVDLSDARTPGTTSSRGRWEERQAKYVHWAANRGMRVTFEFRGSHELTGELTAVRNRGMRSYWFGGPEFSPDSVKRRIEDTLSAVGPRYSKQLNVDVPLWQFIDAMTLSERFIEHVAEHYRSLRKWMKVLRTDAMRTQWTAQSDDVFTACMRLCGLLAPLAVDNNGPIGWGGVAALSSAASTQCRALADAVKKARKAEERSLTASTVAARDEYVYHKWELFDLCSILDELHEFAGTREARLSEAPYMLLVGEAGSGKTHFLCDVAARAVNASGVAILVLGSEEFEGNSIWAEIARGSALPADHDELLGALQSAAEATGNRALLIVDGINEGPSPKFWTRELSVVIGQVKRFSRVALVVSVRNTFLDACVREDAKQRLTEVVHEGFAFGILEAQRAFFNNYGIREPSVPLLLSEFANPLFLTLFCKGIVAAGLAEVPRGLSGITTIFNFFIDAQNAKISEQLDADPAEHLVHRALTALAAALTAQRPNTIRRAEAKAIVDGVYFSPHYSRSLFGALERENLISTTRFGDASYVRFTYERMADHARANRLLAEIGEDAADPKHLALRLRELLAGAGFGPTGLYDALSIQIPERYGKELFQLLPEQSETWQVDAFLRALPWRKPESVGERAATFVFRVLEREPRLRAMVIECLFTCALIPGNSLNASSLHEYLRKLDLPRRDMLWSIPISRKPPAASPIRRMQSWALAGAFGLGGNARERAASADAAALSLLWLCASAYAGIRDAATKGVVAILEAAPAIATTLYARFCDVNDPYVAQRLYAALAGWAMRTFHPSEDLSRLAQAVLHRAQDAGLPVDILARDYARTIVERALALGAISSDVDVGAVRPPYGASPPDFSEADTALFEQHRPSPREGSTSEGASSALEHLHASLGPKGGFARGDVGNFRADWLAARLDDGAPAEARAHGGNERFDFTRARHWMFRRVLEIGHGGRAIIGWMQSKYEWIAYFELSARMADNYYLESWRSGRAPVRYDVPAQLLKRDIDPSLRIVARRPSRDDPYLQSWWAGPSYGDWREHDDDDKWMRDTHSLPDPRSALIVTDSDGAEWVSLGTRLSWREPGLPVLLDEGYDMPRRMLWYLIFGYLIPKSQAEQAHRWLSRQNFAGRWLRRDPHEVNQLHWGELFWAPAFALESAAFTVPAYALQDAGRMFTERFLTPAMGTYVHEDRNDTASLRTILISFPIAEIVRGIGSAASVPESGAWLDASGQTVCVDPSITEAGPRTVLVRRDRLEAFLHASPYALVWTLLGEKHVVGEHSFRTYRGRLVTSGAYWLCEAADGTFTLGGDKKSRFEE